MTVEDTVSAHYATGGLLDRIKAGLAAAGADPDAPSPDDLKAVDEFHIGGVAATRDLIDQVGITADMHHLDIGSGLGGTPRFIAGATGCSVTGIDLTREFVETATALSRMVGLDGRTRFQVGSALDLPFDDAAFDTASLIHVGMNIPDKTRLMAQAARVLKPGGTFAVYDVMRTNDQEITFPVPWAETPAGSFLATLDDYSSAAGSAGFEVTATRNRADFALDFFARMQAAMASAGGPPPLGLHLLMGETRSQKVANMVTNIAAGRYAPTELIMRKPE